MRFICGSLNLSRNLLSDGRPKIGNMPEAGRKYEGMPFKFAGEVYRAGNSSGESYCSHLICRKEFDGNGSRLLSARSIACTKKVGDSEIFSIPRARLSNQFIKIKETWSQRGATISKARDSRCSMSRRAPGVSRRSNHDQGTGSFSPSALSRPILRGSNFLNIDELRESRPKKKICFSADVEVFHIPHDISERSWQASSARSLSEFGMNGTLGWLDSPPKRKVRFSNDVEVFRIPSDSLDGNQKISPVGHDGLLGVAGILGRQVGEGGVDF
ncbi:hypothetical protein BCO18442_00730 [Burkholderia contaminans]|nr:hypothetical protein BCO18442_00730 [Burkholderia contaminans]